MSYTNLGMSLPPKPFFEMYPAANVPAITPDAIRKKAEQAEKSEQIKKIGTRVIVAGVVVSVLAVVMTTSKNGKKK